jgi:predicted Zn-dependent protease
MNKARQEGRHADVLKVYGQMPEKVRRQKHVQLFRLGSAPLVSEEEYKLALADAAPIFKDEVAADLLAIDALIYRNKYDDALAAADRIDKRIGGDPYLDVIRGTITMTAGKPAEAKAFAQSALKREPGLYAARDLLLSLAVQEKDHAETARLLTLFEKEHGLDFDDLKAAEGYEAFVQSQEYQQWLKRPRPKR